MRVQKLIILFLTYAALLFVIASPCHAGDVCNKICGLPISWLHQLICLPCTAIGVGEMAKDIAIGIKNSRDERLQDDTTVKATGQEEIEHILIELHKECSGELTAGGDYRIVSKRIETDKQDIYCTLTCFNDDTNRKLCIQEKDRDAGEEKEHCKDIPAIVDNKKTERPGFETDDKNEKL